MNGVTDTLCNARTTSCGMASGWRHSLGLVCRFKHLISSTSPLVRTDLCRWPLPKATHTSCLHLTQSSPAAAQPAALVAWGGHSRPDAAVQTLRACRAAMPCSSLSSAAVYVSALVQTCRQKGCHTCSSCFACLEAGLAKQG